MFRNLKQLILISTICLSFTASLHAAIPNSPGSYIGVTSISNTSVRVNFLDNSNNENGFRIYDGDSIDITVPSNDESTQTNQYATLTGLEYDKTYTIQVVAFNSDGESLPSDTRSFTINSTFGYPKTPGPYIGVTSIDKTSVRISFLDNSNNEAGFKIYDGSAIDVTLAPNDETQARKRYVYKTLTGLNCNETYTIKAKSFNSQGESTPSLAKTFNIQNTFGITCNNLQNEQPIANAGSTQTVTEGTTVTLSGSNSYDPNGDSLSYKWQLISKPTNSNAVLSDTTVENPTFLADKQGSYTFELIVNDGQLDSTPSRTTVLANSHVSQTQEVSLCSNQSAYINTLYSLGMTINSTTNHGTVLSKNNNFIGAVVCSKLTGVSSSSDVLSMLKNNAFPSATTVISNNGADGSIKAQFELNGANTQSFAQLKSILQALGETDFSNYIDYSGFDSIQDFFIDVLVHYVNNETTFIIVSVTDKTENNVNELNSLVTRNIISQTNNQNTNTDTFAYSGNTLKADVLFVMDDSGSMSQEQGAASQAIITTFGSAMSSKGVNWKATVIGTEEGRNYLNKHISNPSENNITKLANQLLLGTNGYDEVGLKRAYQYLTNNDINIRNNSKLSIVYVSDEICHTSLAELGVTDINDSYFVQNGIKVNVIIPENLSHNGNLAYQMANTTNGEVANIYNYSAGYDAMMQKIADDAAGSASQIILSQTPIASSIQVSVNGSIILNGWSYSIANNSIVFDVLSTPNSGDVINVTYNY
ncbi:MAG TPA: fibronectin type III domain-containing protein [Bacteroidetes bacterium]|nr:fibronectin type III domain-containing protein [Bacteroidota bacterium]